jgi:uroporphyrinogen decarboxylase
VLHSSRCSGLKVIKALQVYPKEVKLSELCDVKTSKSKEPICRWILTGATVIDEQAIQGIREKAQPTPTHSDLVNMVVDFSIEIGKVTIDMGVDVIEISNDSGYVSGPTLSPKLFHEFITPTLERQVRAFKRKGAIVFVHCDGNVYPILDDMVSAGIDGWHAIEPQAGMDIGYVKEKYGDRTCLIGNIDVSHTLPFGSEEDVVREVKERINLAAPGGGYILSSSNSIHRGVKPSNAIAMYRADRKYGVYVKR